MRVAIASIERTYRRRHTARPARPVVAAKCGEDAETSQAATLVGSEGVILGKDTAAYIDRVGKIVKDKNYRAKLGKMRGRVVKRPADQFVTKFVRAQRQLVSIPGKK